VNFVDSHCHLDMLETSATYGVQDYLTAAQERGVDHFLCVCVTLDKFNSMLQCVAPFNQVSVSVGLHPNEPAPTEPDVEELLTLAANPRVVAIGETGLDYYRSDEDNSWQANRFRTHIQAAKTCKKPLIIHSRQARADTIAMMRDEQAADAGGVLHCFTEDWTMAKAALDLGFYISFSGIVTFKNALELQDVARKVPLDRMLIETDCPYLAPVPNRGKPNEPAYVVDVAVFLAQLRNEPLETIAAQTTQNFYQLFQGARRAV
jgi:TatD DNase family protein